MFNSFEEANNAINNNCNQQLGFKVLTDLKVGSLIKNADDTIVNGIIVKDGLIYEIVNSVITNIYTNQTTNVSCVDLSNHGLARPHLYGQYRSNKIAGSVCANTQIYYLSQNGNYKPIPYAGKLKNTNLGCYFYREDYLGNQFNVNLRTNSNCTNYPDVRNSFPENQNFDDKLDLNSYANATYSSVDYDVMFYFSTFFPQGNPVKTCYRMDINKQINNLSYRINNGAWQSTTVKNVDSNNIQFLHTETNNLFLHEKDFCLDLTTNGTDINRYLIRCTGAGGHFASIYTVKNMQNGKTHVTTFQQDELLPVKLELNGQTYLGDETICCAINLGVVNQDGLGILKSQETGLIIDNNLKILSI